MKVTVNTTMKVDGVISCNGGSGSSAYSGGGSGGSIWIEANLIRGYGKMQVSSFIKLCRKLSIFGEICSIFILI